MSEEDQKAIRKRIRDPLAETKRKLRLKEKAVEVEYLLMKWTENLKFILFS